MVDLTWRPKLSDLARMGGPAEPTASAATLESAIEAAKRPRTSPPALFDGREGYDANFLDFEVDPPTPAAAGETDVLTIEGTGAHRLDYLHFSVVMSRSRKIAMFVACNIEGARSRSIERTDDVWALDGRIPRDCQIGPELYVDNELDRGHLVRREDPNWGTSEEAEQANRDTFHYTNCTPQMAAFNQRTWLSLENYVLSEARASRDRITVFTGPVLRGDDPVYRGVRIPTAYWKVIAFVDKSGRPSATAYTIDQTSELATLEATFGRFKTYQRSVAQISAMTFLDFGVLKDFDGFSNEEREKGIRIEAIIRGPADIRI